MGIYQRLGVRPFVNARGTYSIIGGSLAHREVTEAMAEASRGFVDTIELQRAVGKRLADLTNNEAAFVSLGAAGGLLLAACAAMAGTDAKRRAQLPDTTGMKDEAIAQAINQTPYAACTLGSGIKLRWVGDPERPTVAEIEEAIGPKKACLFYFVNPELNQVPLDQVVEVCHRRGVPVIVDAAAQFPPFENTWRFTRDLGADLAIFSGGKGFRGPQSAGLMVGSREMIERVLFFCPPTHSVARTAKASRELIVGMLAAVEVMARVPSADLFASFEARLDTIYRMLDGIPGVSVRKQFGTDVGKPFNHILLSLDERLAVVTFEALARALDEGNPRIAVGYPGNGEVYINAEMLEPGEEYIVAGRIIEILKSRS